MTALKRHSRYSTVFAFSIILLFSHDAYAFDFVKKLIYPVEYWTEQVVKNEEEVDFYRKQLIVCRLEFKKLKQTKKIIIRQNILDGMSPEEAWDDFFEEWNATKLACKVMKDLYEMANTDLNKAQAELEKAHIDQ